MKIFITGASGFIGSRLAFRLAADKNEVTVLLRDPTMTNMFTDNGINVTPGDIFNIEQLNAGMRNCDWVFHLAAYTKPFSKDPELPFRTNVTGTINVFDAAKKQSVKKVIITSTAGTLGYSVNGLPVDEETNENPVYHTDYERTKAISEKAAIEYYSKVLDIIIVNPTRVYGPGKLTLSNSVTRIIKLYGSGLWRIIPADGNAIGNYVYIDDIVNGHILAAMNGKSGEKYILGGENLSYNEFFRILGEVYGHKRNLLNLSKPCLKRIIRIAGFYSKVTGKPSGITDEWIERYLENWILSSNKAQRDLNYKITSFKDGVEKTIMWLGSKNMHYGE